MQIRALASKYDAAFNRHKAAAVATLYTEEVVFKMPNGTFNGRQAIEELFGRHYFEESIQELYHYGQGGNRRRQRGTRNQKME